MKNKRIMLQLIVSICLLSVLLFGLSYAYFIGGDINTTSSTDFSGTTASALNISLISTSAEINLDVASKNMLLGDYNYYVPASNTNGSFQVRLDAGIETEPITCEYDLYYVYLSDSNTTDYIRTNPEKKEFTYTIKRNSLEAISETNFVNSTSTPQKLGGTYSITSYGKQSIDVFNINVNFYNLEDDQIALANGKYKIKFYVSTDINRCNIGKGFLTLSPGIYDGDGVLIDSYDDIVALYGFDPTTDEGSEYTYEDDSWYYDGNEITFNSIPSYIPYKALSSDRYQNATKLVLPEGIDYIGDSAFANAPIKTIYVPHSVESVGTDAFKNIDNVFYDGPASVNGDKYGSTRLLPYSIYEENGFIYYDNTKSRLIAYDGNSDSLLIPDSVIKIDDNTFRNSDVTSITFGGNSKIENIGYAAFANSKVAVLNIPDSVSTIGNFAFYNIPIVYYTGDAINDINASENNSGPGGGGGKKALYHGNSDDYFSHNIDWGAISLNPNLAKALAPGLYTNTLKLVESYENLVSSYGFDITYDGLYGYKYDYYNDEYIYGYFDEDNDVYITAPLNEIHSFLPISILSKEKYEQGVVLVLPDGINKIGNHALDGLKIRKVVIPSSVTEFGISSFEESSIRDIEFKEDSHLIRVGANALAKSSLRSIVIFGI